jgi:hypothetical protein
MRNLLRNKRLLYVCNHYQDGRITKFHEPIPINVNYQATNSDGDLIALGMDFPMYMRIKADLSDVTNFKAEDRVYIMRTPSEPFDVLCKDADYEVDSDPIISLNSVEITLKKLSGK